MEYFHPGGSMLCYMQVERGAVSQALVGCVGGWRREGGKPLVHPNLCKLLALQQSLEGLDSLPPLDHPPIYPELESLSGDLTRGSSCLPHPTHGANLLPDSLTHLPASNPANLLHWGHSSTDRDVQNPQAPHVSSSPRWQLPAHLPYCPSCGRKV